MAGERTKAKLTLECEASPFLPMFNPDPLLHFQIVFESAVLALRWREDRELMESTKLYSLARREGAHGNAADIHQLLRLIAMVSRTDHLPRSWHPTALRMAGAWQRNGGSDFLANCCHISRSCLRSYRRGTLSWTSGWQSRIRHRHSSRSRMRSMRSARTRSHHRQRATQPEHPVFHTTCWQCTVSLAACGDWTCIHTSESR